MNTESRQQNSLLVIPARNEGAALHDVVRAALAVHPRVLVVDDGSDTPVNVAGATVIRHATRRGRGAAILSGAEEASRQGMTHLVTLDVAGGSDPADVPRLVSALDDHPNSIVIGRRRFASRESLGFARLTRRLAGFWLRVQTGRSVGDVQSGFRVYPVALLRALPIWSRGIAFEPEVLTRAAWAGISFHEVDVACGCKPARHGEAGARLAADYLLWGLLTVHLTLRSVVPWPHRRLLPDKAALERMTILHPLRALRRLVSANTSPHQIGLAVAMGVLLGTLPLVFVHTIAILLAASFFGLNKTAAVVASQICMPPIVPALCIELGYFLRHGRFLTDLSLNTLGYQAWDRCLEWILGSLVLAPVLAAMVGLAAFVMALAAARDRSPLLTRPGWMRGKADRNGACQAPASTGNQGSGGQGSGRKRLLNPEP